MNITKLTHACLLIEDNQKQLLIDPGVFTEDIPELPFLSGVIVTHAHPDHVNGVWLEQLQEAKPDIPFYANQEVADTYPKVTFTVIGSDQVITIGTFTIDIWVTDHAVIHNDIPVIKNLAVMVNDTVFYPGDSFYKPAKPVRILACPASAPWLNAADVIDYIGTVKAQTVFPTHDALLSDTGNMIQHNFMKESCKTAGSKWVYAIPGEQLDIS